MKKHELDRLFQQKLEEMEVSPSRQAWQQLEGQLQKKSNGRRRFFLSGIAAAILLLLGVWGSFEYSLHFVPAAPVALEQENPVDANRTPAKENAPIIITTPKKQPIAKTETKTKSATAEPLKDRKASAKLLSESKHTGEKSGRAARTTGQDANKTAKAMATKGTVEKEILLAKAKSPLKEAIAAADLETITIIEQEIPLPEKVVIRYKADGMEQKQLSDTPGSGSMAKKEPAAGKIFGFLKKVKDNSSGGLAELREAKDELLSFNFRSNK